MVTEEKPHIWERFIIFSETHSKTMKVVSYGITSITLVVALYRIRPFSKYTKPSSIPSHFFHKKVSLRGTAIHIDPTYGTLLMVDHKPLIPLLRLRKPKLLAVKIAGINVTANGISWLQTLVIGKDITFTPLANEKQYLSCMITILQKNQEQINIGKELVKLGFALVEKDSLIFMTKDKGILNYQKHLLKAQKWAELKRNGHWHFAKNPTLLWKLQQSLIKKIRSILPIFIARQFNI